MNLTYINPARKYYNEEVHCGGAKGDSVKLELTGCIASLSVVEIKVYKGPHCLSITRLGLILYWVKFKKVFIYFFLNLTQERGVIF